MSFMVLKTTHEDTLPSCDRRRSMSAIRIFFVAAVTRSPPTVQVTYLSWTLSRAHRWYRRSGAQKTCVVAS